MPHFISLSNLYEVIIVLSQAGIGFMGGGTISGITGTGMAVLPVRGAVIFQY